MEQSYKEKYEQAIERLKQWDREHHCAGYVLSDRDKFIFPELAESEDEKVRKAIMALIEWSKSYSASGITNDDAKKMLSWLEKQEGCEYIKKDWLEHIKQSWYKEGFIDGKYSGGTSKEWTINDAATLKELIDFLENGTAKLQHDLTRYANWLKNQFTPIEKQGEQKSEENKGNIGGISANPEWSEEDERLCQCLIEDQEEVLDKVIIVKYGHSEIISDLKEIYRKRIDWLQSLKDRVQPKQEWSEEDKYMYDILCGTIENTDINENTKYKLISWLKSLRPQNRWKPSDEQIDLLQAIINEPNNAASESCQIVLKDILEQLKKLKKEQA